MIIHGLNKLTLVDYPGLMAAIIFTGNCNFRCPFCHNASLVLNPDSQPVISEEEVLAFLEKRKGMLDGVVFSGGEPLINKDIEVFMRKVKALGYKIKLDTNGSFPEKLSSLISEGLVDYVAMDIKNDLESYGKTIGISGYDTAPIERSIALLKEGRVDYEFRTTVVKELHYGKNFENISALISPCRRYFLQTFVDSGDTIKKGLTAPTEDAMESYVKYLRTYISEVSVRDSI